MTKNKWVPEFIPMICVELFPCRFLSGLIWAQFFQLFLVMLYIQYNPADLIHDFAVSAQHCHNVWNNSPHTPNCVMGVRLTCFLSPHFSSPCALVLQVPGNLFISVQDWTIHLSSGVPGPLSTAGTWIMMENAHGDMHPSLHRVKLLSWSCYYIFGLELNPCRWDIYIFSITNIIHVIVGFFSVELYLFQCLIILNDEETWKV